MLKWLIKYVPVGRKDCRLHKRMIAILLKENAELKKKSKSLRNPDQSINSKKSGKKKP